MKFSNLFSYSTLFLLTVSTTLLLSGCGNPAGSDEEEHEEHHQAVGAVLKMNGTEIVRYDDTGLTGKIEVAASQETSLITIYFLNDHGEEFQPDEPGYSLQWEVADESIAEVERQAEDGKWSFHVQGIARDSTTVKFELYHGTHSDFETPQIPVIVN